MLPGWAGVASRRYEAPSTTEYAHDVSADFSSIDERIRFAVTIDASSKSATAVPTASPNRTITVFRLAASGCWSPNCGQTAAGWRLLEISKIEALVVLDDTFSGSRGNSHRDHYQWDVLYARVR